jgi:hypothetical protein
MIERSHWRDIQDGFCHAAWLCLEEQPVEWERLEAFHVIVNWERTPLVSYSVLKLMHSILHGFI